MPAAKKNGNAGNNGAISSTANLDVYDAGSASLHVAVRVRPVLKSGVRASEATQKDIMRVHEGKVVEVQDPDEEKLYLDQVAGRTKEKKYTFDVAFNQQSRNLDIYNGTVRDICLGCMRGHNVTVFAYGATGSGKTYTMVGSESDPGMMVLSLEHVFRAREGLLDNEDVELTCSYIEVYNEVVYDLLVKKSGPLELREDPKLGVCVAGIKRHEVSTPDEIMGLLNAGNARRKTDSTDANATSSRSHAVLEICVARKPKGKGKVTRGKLCLVDLAGSERGAETNNMGQKLRDGANINKSLLALANCINALGKASRGKGGKAYVPYRNSKLTRLLKDGLSGNCKTAMIATVSASADQYMNSINTLKYADRAKEIKTSISTGPKVPNKAIAAQEDENKADEYQQIITGLQRQLQSMKQQLEAQTQQRDNLQTLPSGRPDEILEKLMDRQQSLGVENSGDGDNPQAAWLESIAAQMSDNTAERINLQKAFFELEDATVCTKAEIQQLEKAKKARTAPQDVDARIAALQAAIQENEEMARGYRKEVEENESQRCSLQRQIDDAMKDSQNTTFLRMIGAFRVQAIKLQEQQFQCAVRDQVIEEQRSVISNLWQVINGAGLSREDIQNIAANQGTILKGLIGLQDADIGQSLGPGSREWKKKSIFNVSRANFRYDFWKNQGEGGGFGGGLFDTVRRSTNFLRRRRAVVPGQ